MIDFSGPGEYEAGKEKITVYSLQKTRLHCLFKYTLSITVVSLEYTTSLHEGF